MNTEFTDQLQQAMTRLPAPVPPDMVKNVCRRHRRRRAAKWGVTAAGTASIAGLAAVLALSSSTPAARIARPVDRETAYTVSNVVRALESLAPGSILFDKQTFLHPGNEPAVDYGWSAQDESGGLITWQRTRDRQYSAAGQLVTDQEQTLTPTTNATVIVDYQTRTWSQITATLPAESASPSASAPSCAAGVPYAWSPDPEQEAATLRTAVSCGILTATDGGIIDGVNTVKLSQRPGAPTTITVWIDATTYLPVRIVQVWADTTLSSADIQMDMRWLPPTPANQANLTLHIPAGFTQKPWS
jgi:hypothetical protein